MKYPIVLRWDYDGKIWGLFTTLQTVLEIADDPQHAKDRAAFYYDQFCAAHLRQEPKPRVHVSLGIDRPPQDGPCFCPDPPEEHGYTVLGMITTFFKRDNALFDRLRIEILELPEDIPFTPEIFTPCRFTAGTFNGVKAFGEEPAPVAAPNQGSASGRGV